MLMSGGKTGSGFTGGAFLCKDGHKEQWQLRYSKRAKRARIGVSPQKGIEVVLPAGSRMDAAAFVEQHRGFIDRALMRMRPQREAYLGSLTAPLPTAIELPTAGELWQVEYRDTASTMDGAAAFFPAMSAQSPKDPDGQVLQGAQLADREQFLPAATPPRKGISYRMKHVHDGGGTLTLSGDVHDAGTCHAALRRFVIARAKVALPELLAATAGEFGIAVDACSVKNTRTRLGSCSSKGRIMLAAQLVFYPPELSFHIMCHELAHLGQLDHSTAFHARLASLDPAASRHAKELKRASIYVPAWMDGA